MYSTAQHGLEMNARHRDEEALTVWIKNGRSGGKPIHENHDGWQLRYNCMTWCWEVFTPKGEKAHPEHGGWKALYVAKDAVPELAARWTADLVVAHGHSEHPEWHSGGPGKTAHEDYRWQCACGHRYDEIVGDGVHPRHAAHLAGVVAAVTVRPGDVVDLDAK